MPLKLNVGLAKKVGLPDYGSLGASCNVELELDAHLLSRDGQLFQQQVRQAFAACAQAVQDELARQSAATPTLAASHYPNGNGRENGHTATASNGHNGNGSSRNGRGKSNGRKATSAQVRAICAIAGRHRLNLAHELQSRFQVDRPDDLSVGDASRFIDELQAAAAGPGGG
ncbi:MAG: hypothetical protein HY290_29590 [Planctomycetia bacterium]|nr:hypothetical protein [Planctomycetia bacterium]